MLLLTTKLYVPPARANLVARTRLVERIQDGLRGKLTLISAPAGFGKTTLVSAWHATRAGQEIALAWVSLDTGDRDPLRFWSYLIAALDALVPDLGAAALRLLEAAQPPPIETVLAPLLNALAAASTDMVLVLDDYHLIDTPAIHAALTFLIDQLPPRLHLVLTTRADPPLPLARLRANGTLTELRAEDLRFTPDEGAAFLTMVMGLPLSAEQLSALEARTEGWIAGLQFAALAMRDHRDLAGFINAFTGSNHFVVDYLAEEVLNRLSPRIQQFLLQTAILDRMCSPLCDALVLSEQPGPQQAQSQSLLEALDRANLFLVPLDDARQWYRYHHLFADMLRARLASGVMGETVAALHRRASAWFEGQGLVPEAVSHALAAHDTERAARLLELHGEAVWMRGEMTTLIDWLTALPDTAFEARPTLALTHAFSTAALDDFALSERRLAAAERALHALPVPDMTRLGQAAMVRISIALMADHPAEEAISAGRQALELLPPSSLGWRTHAQMMLGVSYYAQAGDLAQGVPLLTEVAQTALRIGDQYTAINAAAHLSIALEIGGRLRESRRLNQQLLERAAEPLWEGVPVAGYARFGLGRVLYEHNELESARDHLVEAAAQLEAWSLKRPLLVSGALLAWVYQTLGEPAQAREWIQRVAAIVRKDDLRQTFSHWGAYQARIDLAQGDLDAAARWAQELEPTTHGTLSAALEFEHITLVRVYLSQARLEEAQRLLAALLSAAQHAGRTGRVVIISALRAVAVDTLGARGEALNILEEALVLAAPEGYLRTFVDAGAPMAELLAQLAGSQSRTAAYAGKLLGAFQAGEAVPQPSRRSAPLSSELPPAAGKDARVASQALVEPLSERELEVLQLIAAGYSNQKIADRLVIALSTVKKHVNNCYAKLAVQSRTQALARAHELHLL